MRHVLRSDDDLDDEEIMKNAGVKMEIRRSSAMLCQDTTPSDPFGSSCGQPEQVSNMVHKLDSIPKGMHISEAEAALNKAWDKLMDIHWLDSSGREHVSKLILLRLPLKTCLHLYL